VRTRRGVVHGHPRFFDPCFAPNPKRLSERETPPAASAGLRFPRASTRESLRAEEALRLRLPLRLAGFPGRAAAGLAALARVPFVALAVFAGRECPLVPALAVVWFPLPFPFRDAPLECALFAPLECALLAPLDAHRDPAARLAELREAPLRDSVVLRFDRLLDPDAAGLRSRGAGRLK